MILLLFFIYATTCWTLTRLDSVRWQPSFWQGGRITPHGILVDSKPPSLLLVGVWVSLFTVLICLGHFIDETGWAIPDQTGTVSLLLFLELSALSLFPEIIPRTILHLRTSEKPALAAFPIESYPLAWVYVGDPTDWERLHTDPILGPQLEPCGWPRLRKLASRYLDHLKAIAPETTVLPLSKAMENYLQKSWQELTTLSLTQAEKAIRAQNETQSMQQRLLQFQSELQQLQETNQTLHNQLTCLRTRHRGTTTKDYSLMTPAELDAERHQLLNQLRQVDHPTRIHTERRDPYPKSPDG